MFDKFFLPALVLGVLVQMVARLADSAGLIDASTRGILYGISLVLYGSGLVFLRADRR
jgi:hypothetical protein